MPGARESGEDVTGLLRAWRQGDARAGKELLEHVDPRLKRFASPQLERDVAWPRA